MSPATCKLYVSAHADPRSSYRFRVPKTTRTIDAVDVLQRLLDDKGWHQKDLAEKLYKDERTISRWMTGETRVSERMLRKAFAQLDIDPKPYGLDPIVVQTGVAVEGGNAAHELALLRARIELMAADIRAIRDHFEIPAPVIEQART